MKLCMFHPVDHPMERGWVGRIEGDHVVHLAAQTLQAFFTGGGARDHAVYPLGAVRLLPPVLHPPSVRVFDTEAAFEFRNPAAVVGPDAEIHGSADLALLPRVGAVIAAGGEIGGLTLAADWRRAGAPGPKDRDFALGTGPVVATLDEPGIDSMPTLLRVDGKEQRLALPAFDWTEAAALAAEGTRLYPGDVLVGPSVEQAVGLNGSHVVEVETLAIGTLRQRVVGG
jgi:hypothetical protein